MSEKEELDQIIAHLRHHEEYRIKIFGFFITINGSLLAVISSLDRSKGDYIYLYLFAFVATFFGLFNEVRSSKIADKYRLAAIEVERRLGYTEILKVHQDILKDINSRKIVLRYIYVMFYILTLVIWGFLLIKV